MEDSQRMALVMLQLVAGEAHTLTRTDSGAVYGWGRGMFGRLGTGRDEDEHVPIRVPILAERNEDRSVQSDGHHVKAISVAAGAYHSMALSDEGVVWSWGYNAYGQLGREDGQHGVPCPMEFPDPEHGLSKLVSLKAGGMMSCAIDEDGMLWIWGLCPRLGHNGNDTGTSSLQAFTMPERVSGLSGKHVLKVACGNEHILALASSPEAACYAWGNNSHGQLGLGDTGNRSSPHTVQAMKESSDGCPKDVACGAFHSVVIMEHRNFSSCWTFGLGENGQLGHGTTTSLSTPKCVNLTPEEKVLGVECGLFHTCCVSESGLVWAWGMERGLGLFPTTVSMGAEDSGDALVPTRLFNTDAAHFRGIACGAAHTAILADDGCSILAWGRGQHGVLGTGSETDSTVPCNVAWPPLDLQVSKELNNDAQKETGSSENNNNNSSYELLSENLAAARKEICDLKEELTAVKHRADVLQSAIYGGDNRLLDEWEREIGNASNHDLVKLESLHRHMCNHVKETTLRRKVEHWCKSLMTNQSKDLAEDNAEELAYSVSELKDLSHRLNQLANKIS